MAELDRLAGPAGTLILSGLRDLQEAELLCHYQEQGWSLVRRLSRKEWAIEVPLQAVSPGWPICCAADNGWCRDSSLARYLELLISGASSRYLRP